MKNFLAVLVLLISFAAHAETLPEPSIDTEPRGCNNTSTPCLGWRFAFQKWMDDKGQRHHYAEVFIDKKDAPNVGAAYNLAVGKMNAK